MLSKVLSALLLLAPCAAQAAMPNPNWPAPANRGESLLRGVALQLHNRARQSFGVAPVVWSEEMAGAARAYAATMAATGIYEHDQTPGRRKRMGENLWRGARGLFSYEVMLGVMIDEGRNFRPGVFPAVSRTGSWHDVGHYTQIVWPTTTEIGCGLASNAANDFLVCRYAPTGNQDGVALISTPRLAERGD